MPYSKKEKEKRKAIKQLDKLAKNKNLKVGYAKLEKKVVKEKKG